MQQLQQQNNSANMEARNNKRDATEALAAGYNFHTAPPAAAQVGTVNCSAAEPSSKRSKAASACEMLREWYATSKAENKQIDYMDCARQFASFNAAMQQPGIAGTVNASKGGLWSKHDLVESSTTNPVLMNSWLLSIKTVFLYRYWRLWRY